MNCISVSLISIAGNENQNDLFNPFNEGIAKKIMEKDLYNEIQRHQNNEIMEKCLFFSMQINGLSVEKKNVYFQ